jgi:hypothetical protein
VSPPVIDHAKWAISLNFDLSLSLSLALLEIYESLTTYVWQTFYIFFSGLKGEKSSKGTLPFSSLQRLHLTIHNVDLSLIHTSLNKSSSSSQPVYIVFPLSPSKILYIWECPDQNKVCSIDFPISLPCFDLDTHIWCCTNVTLAIADSSCFYF